MKIVILPQNVEISAAKGDNLYRVLADAGVFLSGDCGGRGICRRCFVRIKKGLLPPTAEEGLALSPAQIEQGYRLACLHKVNGDLVVETPDLRQKNYVSLNKKATSLRQKLMMVFDVGTTSVAGGLLDFETGELLATADTHNRQAVFGADVISRITYCLEHHEGAAKLQDAVWRDLADLTERLLTACSAKNQQVLKIVLVANSTISHLLWGICPRGLAKAPYRLVFHQMKRSPLQNLSIAHLLPEVKAEVILLPNIGGFLGSDTIAAMLACDLWVKKDQPQWSMLLDIGTNGEIVLAGHGRVLAASAAAGPAFEGASITCGMRGEPGALQAVQLTKEKLVLKTVADEPLRGICGSGLLSLIALLRREGVINKKGRLQAAGKLAERIFDDQGKRFLLDGQVFLTQGDIRQFQLAKGAITACWQSLLNEAAIEEKDLSAVFLAGSFGNNLSINDALMVGLLPDIAAYKTHYVGNAAWQGAYLTAVESSRLAEAEKLASAVEYINTAEKKGFDQVFVKALSL
jgi:uncharacterized 2Fe-2S/4Fe-4S cluster protein (DUF4445 family)